ncbi:hypothetical protein [Methylobacterium sp. GC_Met_2]|uniref:hypothetical protein n=1 Tax=Methylobacterium sp. GC_Met_2 TaxID=2937376 RepID=UPI00226B9D8D|nr:hypothetical protein [Methylobacterium sp. GC_Met_2]
MAKPVYLSLERRASAAAFGRLGSTDQSGLALVERREAPVGLAVANIDNNDHLPLHETLEAVSSVPT